MTKWGWILFGALSAGWLLLRLPWLVGVLTGVCWYQWYKLWRFKDLRQGDVKRFFNKHCVYIDDSADGTCRYWFDGHNIVTQAKENGKMYWSVADEVTDWQKRFQLQGFQAFGREWPRTYRQTMSHILRHNKQRQERIEKSWNRTAVMEHLCRNPKSEKLLDCVETSQNQNDVCEKSFSRNTPPVEVNDWF